MKYNFNVPITDLNGNAIIDPNSSEGFALNVGKALAQFCAGKADPDPVKWLDWALSLNRHEPIELDKSDMVKLYDFVKQHPAITALLKVQILNILDEKENKAVSNGNTQAEVKQKKEGNKTSL